MNLAELKASVGSRRKRRRVGRGPGSTRGKTCGRGHKGYGQRAGSGGRLLYEGGQMPLYRRLPKKGFANARFKKAIAIINVRELNRFEDGTEVSLAHLQDLGVRSREYRLLKILGEGELTRKLLVTADRFSSSAVEKIKAAGGEARLVKC